MKFYAHSTDNPDKSDWQTLENHLQGVAELAEEFAAVFGAGEWGRLAGENHDIGKGTLGLKRLIPSGLFAPAMSPPPALLAKR